VRQSLDRAIGSVIAHFLNCLIGKVLCASIEGSLSNMQSKTLMHSCSWLSFARIYMQKLCFR
jgi:hypothetical protein